MRILFAGSPEIAVPSLHLLHEHHTICAILTNPARPTGRGRAVSETAVSLAATEMSVPLLKPDRLGAAFREQVKGYNPQLLVVVAFGRFFGPKFLSLFPRGAVNLHPSLLPKYRGPSPIPAAILNGDREVGITVQRLSQEMDSGDILAQVRLALSGRETTGTLTARVAEHGAELLNDVLRRLDSIVPVAQDSESASYCRLISKDDGIIDWRKSAVEIDRMVRAYTPWPSARTTFSGVGLQLLEAEPLAPGPGDDEAGASAEAREGGMAVAPGQVIGVDKRNGILVQTGSGILVVKRLKLQAKKALRWTDFLNGVHGFLGSVLGGQT